MMNPPTASVRAEILPVANPASGIMITSATPPAVSASPAWWRYSPAAAA